MGAPAAQRTQQLAPRAAAQAPQIGTQAAQRERIGPAVRPQVFRQPVLEHVEIAQPAAAAREPAALRDQLGGVRQRQGSAQRHEPRAYASQLDAKLVQRLDVGVVLDPRQQ